MVDTRSPKQRTPLAPSASDGMVRFNVSVTVDVAEFATWKPEAVRAFFAGLATVISAREAMR